MIGMEWPDGSVEAIFCYSDGYVHGVGATLVRHYAMREKANALIALGNISSLDAEIGEAHGQDRVDGQCHAYMRDCGRDDEEAIVHATVADFTMSSLSQMEHLYLYTRDGRWLGTVDGQWYDLSVLCSARVV